MFTNTGTTEDCETREIFESASFETQSRQNMEGRDGLEYRVELNSARNGSRRKPRGTGKFKFKSRYIFAVPVFMLLAFIGNFLVEDLFNTKFQKHSLEETMTSSEASQFQSKNPGDAKEKARTFFQSCLTDCKEVKNHNTTAEEVNDPCINGTLDKLANCSSLQEKLEYLHNELGFSPLFHWNVAPDLKDSKTNVLHITPVLGKTEMSPEIFSFLSEVMGSTFDLVFNNRFDPEDKDKELKSLVSMEMKIMTEIGQDQNLDVISLYNPMTLVQLQKQVDMINWPQFFNDALKRADQGQGKRVELNDKIIVRNLPQLKNFGKMLTKLRNEHSQKTFGSILDKFLVWLVLKPSAAPFMAEESCPYICKKETVRQFEFAVAALLLEKSPTFSPPGGWPAIFSAVREMAESIRAELIQVLEKSSWHEGVGEYSVNSIQISLVEKAKATRFKIGYPELIDDSQQLNEYYAAYGNMNKSDYFENLKQISIAKRIEDSKLFGKSVDKSKWLTGEENGLGITVVSGNAGHMMQSNEILIPVGILFAPVFDLNATLAQNYGALGMIIGHELFHGFAPKCLDFDKDGNFQNTTFRMTRNFPDCLIKHYSSFQYLDGSNLNGSWTLDENVADNGGLKIAMRAFLHQLERQRSTVATKLQIQGSQDPHLQNLEELRAFFRSFAGTWCGIEHYTKSTMAPGDPHSPGKFRVLGALKNTPEFQQAFSCPQKKSLLSECPAL